MVPINICSFVKEKSALQRTELSKQLKDNEHLKQYVIGKLLGLYRNNFSSKIIEE